MLAAYAAGAAWLLLALSVSGSSAVYTAGHWRTDDAEADNPSPRAYGSIKNESARGATARVVHPRANAGGDTGGALVDAHVLEAGGVVG